MPHFLQDKDIVVAGAGLGGLAFALGLKKQWPAGLPPPRVTVYERDTEAGAPDRAGTSLSLAGTDETGGLVALRDLGVLDAILGHAIAGLDEKGAFKLWDSNWAELMSIRAKPAAGLPTAGIRIARKNLRQTLIDAATAADITIRWGLPCVAAAKLPDGRMSVSLADETTVECDLLVAADGASSKLRASLLPAHALDYAGVVWLGGQATFPDGIPQPITLNWGLQLSGQGKACFYSPVDEHTAVWSVMVPETHPRDRITKASTDEQRREVLAEARGHGAALGPLLQTFADATNLEDVNCLPARDRAPFRHDLAGWGNVVFVGDSNHAVSPAAGYGANLAMKDGWDLARLLCASGELGEAVKAYDDVSVPRAAGVLRSSRLRMRAALWTGWKWVLFRAFVVFGGFMLRLKGQA